MDGPSPRSLILDLLSTLRAGSMPVGALVAAAALFGIPENGVRVALHRLVAQGLVSREGPGCYRLGRAARALNERVVSWRRVEERLRRWDGSWLGVHHPATRGRGAERQDRALRLLGFAPLAPGLSVRPDNLRAGADGVRDELRSLGLAAEALVFTLTGLDAEAERRARGLWDTAALRRGYARSLRALEQSEARLPGLDEASAMVESFALGGRVIRSLVHDPLLPEPLVPAEERRAVVAALRRYDRAGRRSWARFLARHGAPHAPLDLPVDGARAVAHA